MDLYGITPYLERATTLLARGDDTSIRYAALELRYAHEAVAFRQLKQYGSEFPGKLVGEWKADQILRLLASFDPLSDMSGELAIAPVAAEGEMPTEWLTLGSTQAIGWKKFRKYYNKLGSFLHLPTPKADGTPSAKAIPPDSFGAMIEDLQRLTEASVILAMKAIVSAKCRCGGMVYAGQSDFDNGEQVVCGNRLCNAFYLKRRDDSGVEMLAPVHGITFACEKCEAMVPVPLDQVWAIARCPGCALEYRLNLAFMSAVQKPPQIQTPDSNQPNEK